MVLFTEIIFILFLIILLLCLGFNIFVLLNNPSFNYYLILSIILLFIVVNVISFIVVYRSSYKQYRVKYYNFFAVLEILFGGVFIGVLMLFLSNERFINNHENHKINYSRVYDDVDSYVFHDYLCPHCGNKVKTMDKVCKKCGFVLRKDELNYNNIVLSKEDERGIVLATNYEINKNKDKLDNFYLNKIGFSYFKFNDYDCNLLSFDVFDGKVVKIFINVKSFVEENIDDVFSLSDKEINMLRFHRNFKIYYIYDVYGKKIIRVVDHDNYEKFVKVKE